MAESSAVDTARSMPRIKQIDYLSRQLWQAHAAGYIGDDDAQSLAERLHSRRGDSGVAQGALFPLAKDQNAPAAYQQALNIMRRSDTASAVTRTKIIRPAGIPQKGGASMRQQGRYLRTSQRISPRASWRL
jgi:hypothetical protein